MNNNSKRNPDLMRNFVFGVEDGLVSTVGLVSGIASAGLSKSTILLTGITLICVEAFAMAAGSLLSDNSADEFEKHYAISLLRSISGAVVMFFSYFIFGFLVLAPYLFFMPAEAMYVSIAISLLALFGIGIVSARASGTSPVRKAVTMIFVGGLAIFLGIIVGGLAKDIF